MKEMLFIGGPLDGQKIAVNQPRIRHVVGPGEVIEYVKREFLLFDVIFQVMVPSHYGDRAVECLGHHINVALGKVNFDKATSPDVTRLADVWDDGIFNLSPSADFRRNQRTAIVKHFCGGTVVPPRTEDIEAKAMKKNEKQQANVELIQTGMRILGNMVAYGIPTWSAEGCWSKLVNIRLSATKEALEWLLRSSYVERSRSCQYAITTAGREAYEESKLTNSADVADTRAFRVEALTGMDVRGGQTKLTRAVLPGLGSRDGGRNEETNIARCDCIFKIEEIAKEIGQSVEQTRQQMQTGQVHICQQCGKWARFHAHNGPRQQWQSSCITCRKRGRK